MTLFEFRQIYPFRPYTLAHGTNGETLEIVSFPYEENDGVYVKARSTPGDPLSINTYRINNGKLELSFVLTS